MRRKLTSNEKRKKKKKKIFLTFVKQSQKIFIKGAFTLVRFHARFQNKLAHLEMKFFLFYFAKCASLMRNGVRKSLM